MANSFLIFLNIFKFFYGLFSFAVVCVLASIDAYIRGNPGAKLTTKIQQARHKLWDDPKYLDHSFLALESGCKIHYISNLGPDGTTKQTRHMTIFVHGWPNSSVMWRDYLSSQILQQVDGEENGIVAFDLPGHGMSDSLPGYGPDNALNAVTEFILRMQGRHLQRDASNARKGNVVVVGHDWGAFFTLRLATEAPWLADRFIFSNFPIPALVRENVYRRAGAAGKSFSQWLFKPSATILLRQAREYIRPVLAQTSKSFYVAIFQLPRPLPEIIGSIGNQGFLRSAHLNAVEREKVPGDRADEFAALMAGSLGSLERPTSFLQSIRVYREGIAYLPWTKSDTVKDLLRLLTPLGSVKDQEAALAPRGITLFHETGTLLAPATVIWGAQDVAIEEKMSLEGIERYLPKKSQVVMLDKVGHWTPCHPDGIVAFEQVILWTLRGSKGSLDKALIKGKVVGKVTLSQ